MKLGDSTLLNLLKSDVFAGQDANVSEPAFHVQTNCSRHHLMFVFVFKARSLIGRGALKLGKQSSVVMLMGGCCFNAEANKFVVNVS